MGSTSSELKHKKVKRQHTARTLKTTYVAISIYNCATSVKKQTNRLIHVLFDTTTTASVVPFLLPRQQARTAFNLSESWMLFDRDLPISLRSQFRFSEYVLHMMVHFSTRGTRRSSSTTSVVLLNSAKFVSVLLPLRIMPVEHVFSYAAVSSFSRFFSFFVCLDAFSHLGSAYERMFHVQHGKGHEVSHVHLAPTRFLFFRPVFGPCQHLRLPKLKITVGRCDGYP